LDGSIIENEEHEEECPEIDLEYTGISYDFCVAF